MKKIKLKELLSEKKNKGLWANIHAKRKRGESPAKPGDKDYPKTLDIDEDYSNSKWEVYVADDPYGKNRKVMKVAKSKRAAVILYNKLIKTDKYFEVGMRVVKEGKLSEKVQWKKDKKIKGKWYTNQGTHKHQAKANVIAGREWSMGRSRDYDTIVVKEPKGYTIYVRPLKEGKLSEASSNVKNQIKKIMKYDHIDDLADYIEQFDIDKKHWKYIGELFNRIRDEVQGVKPSGYADRYRKDLEKVLFKVIKESTQIATLTEDYEVTIEDRKGKKIQGGKFTMKDDAKLYIKDMIKKHKLRRGKGMWYNDKGVELSTNF